MNKTMMKIRIFKLTKNRKLMRSYKMLNMINGSVRISQDSAQEETLKKVVKILKKNPLKYNPIKIMIGFVKKIPHSVNCWNMLTKELIN